MDSKNTTRREFVKFGIFGMILAPFAGMILNPARAWSADKKAEKKAGKKDGGAKNEPLPAGQTATLESDPVASALGYQSDVTKVDKKKYPQYKKGQACASCALYTAQGTGWGKCQLIQNGLVNAHGWCGSYSKKT